MQYRPITPEPSDGTWPDLSYLRAALPGVGRLARAIARDERGRFPEMLEVARLTNALSEAIVDPPSGEELPQDEILRRLLTLVDRLRAITQGYRTPPDSGIGHWRLCEQMAELDAYARAARAADAERRAVSGPTDDPDRDSDAPPTPVPPV